MKVQVISLLFLLISSQASSSTDIGTTGPEPVGACMFLKKVGDDIYISAKMDERTDILYWFKKCMANELYTFYRVGSFTNSDPVPTTIPEREPEYILNLAYSDNIGPFAVSAGGWCGGNHRYRERTARTACNESYRLIIDGTVIANDIARWAHQITIEAQNIILDPTRPYTAADGSDELRDPLCRERVTYAIHDNNIEVSVTHIFENSDPVTVSIYYGMQSMFEGETYTFTSGGAYTDWTEQSSVSEFTKGQYPDFRRFVERNPVACQSTFLLPDGLGNHAYVGEDDVAFIGNSYGKSYHKLIGYRQMQAGDHIAWSGVYTWFVTPIADDGDLLYYRGCVGGKTAIFIDTKRACDREVRLPEDIDTKNYTMVDRNGQIYFSLDDNGVLTVSATGSGGAVLVFGA